MVGLGWVDWLVRVGSSSVRREISLRVYPLGGVTALVCRLALVGPVVLVGLVVLVILSVLTTLPVPLRQGRV